MGGPQKKHVEMVPQPEYPVEGEVAVAYMVTEVSSEYFPCPALSSKHFANGQAGLNPHHGAGGTAVPNIHHPARVPAGAGVTSRGDPRPARGVTRRGDPTAAATRH